ncbi:energy transducer TonB [Sphingobacterium thalpophilum]|nr:energy transducer TonB [Sphingobacterium thalpophilum]
MMMNSKLNIYRKEWLDVVFAGRNKMYGAYELRNLSDRATNIGLGIVVAFVLVFIVGSYSYNKYFKQALPAVKLTSAVFKSEDLNEIPREADKKEEPVMMPDKAPQQIAQDVSKFDLVHMSEPKVAQAHRVTEDVASQEELNKPHTMTARMTLKANAAGTYVARGEFGPSKKDGAITGHTKGIVSGGSEEANLDEPFITVEVMPSPVGGMQAFMKWVSENYSFPQHALDQGLSGVIEVSFVVERDGTLTDIAIKRDMDFGTGQAAIDLLKKAKKWKPGVQNGRAVRVAYTLPIRLSAVSQ